MIALHPSDWVDVAKQDLFEYVRSGGSLVRFVVARRPSDLNAIRQTLKAEAASANLFFFEVDSAETRLHHPNDLLRAITNQLDFREVITAFVLNAITREGYEVPREAERFVLADVARINEMIPVDVLRLLRRQINLHIAQNKHLVRDVRFAINAMVNDVLVGSDFANGIDITTRWLSGRVTKIKELRDFGIRAKADRYNARRILRSLLNWLPTSGRSGTIIFVDGWRLARIQNPRDGYHFYSRIALIDTYEVIREFVDDTDEMHHALLVFGMPPDFLSVDPRGRGMGAYQALEFRVSSFIESHLANPLANLVEISGDAERRALTRG